MWMDTMNGEDATDVVKRHAGKILAANGANYVCKKDRVYYSNNANLMFKILHKLSALNNSKGDYCLASYVQSPIIGIGAAIVIEKVEGVEVDVNNILSDFGFN